MKFQNEYRNSVNKTVTRFRDERLENLRLRQAAEGEQQKLLEREKIDEKRIIEGVKIENEKLEELRFVEDHSRLTVHVQIWSNYRLFPSLSSYFLNVFTKAAAIKPTIICWIWTFSFIKYPYSNI